MVIYLLHILLHVSSHQIKKMTSSLILLVSVLLQMGFTQPSMSPYQRWALTSPFHPYRPKPAVIFCGTFPWITPARRYLVFRFLEARTFLTPGFSFPGRSYPTACEWQTIRSGQLLQEICAEIKNPAQKNIPIFLFKQKSSPARPWSESPSAQTEQNQNS